MRFFLLSLMVSWALTLSSPPAAIAEPFSSPFTKHGVYDPRIAPYMPPFKKKTTPLHWRHGAYIFPHNCSGDCTKTDKRRTSRPKTAADKKPMVLNPQIFNPEPKTPLTIVIEDGIVVDSYRGYEKQADQE